MQQYLQNKKGLVEGVFNQVYNKYDLMNDFMSLGIHRFWKKSLINIMKPSPNRKLIDVCLLYTSPSPRDGLLSRMPSSA